MAMVELSKNGHLLYCLGQKETTCGNFIIEAKWPELFNFHTISIYLNPTNQLPYIEQIIQASPKRVIFNPGSENQLLYTELSRNNIPYEEACTLVLLKIGKY